MSSKGPLWLKAVHRFERAVGEPVEKVVRSDLYFDAVSKVTRVRRGVGGAVEGLSRRGLHLFNLPAGTDIRRVREQLSRMERRLDRLSADVEDLDEDRRPARVK